MSKRSVFSPVRLLKSIGFALSGIRHLLHTQPNARIHAVATVLVVSAALAFDVRRNEWYWLVVAIALVWITEAFNTALEDLCNVVSPESNPAIKKIKDTAAAAVLLSALAALVIGLMVFWPYIQTTHL